MTTERETIALGSCPACGGPAQFIADEPAPLTYIAGLSYRHVALPNIDEDLGGGWRLSGIEWSAVEASRNLPAWSARGWKPDGGAHSFEVARADTPAAAYLALRTAIEARS